MANGFKSRLKSAGRGARVFTMLICVGASAALIGLTVKLFGAVFCFTVAITFIVGVFAFFDTVKR